MPAAMSPDDVLTYQALRRLSDGPVASQRTLADALGVSVGKANYVARALLEKGLVKLENVSRNPNRLGYLYVLTPKGMARKARLTQRFLNRKIAEYEALQVEIQMLLNEVADPKPAER
jgi:EPS-associated MarR family transcriptional regulator